MVATPDTETTAISAPSTMASTAPRPKASPVPGGGSTCLSPTPSRSLGLPREVAAVSQTDPSFAVINNVYYPENDETKFNNICLITKKGHQPLQDIEIRVGNSSAELQRNPLCAWFPGTIGKYQRRQPRFYKPRNAIQLPEESWINLAYYHHCYLFGAHQHPLTCFKPTNPNCISK